jgi:hypothetical protein
MSNFVSLCLCEPLAEAILAKVEVGLSEILLEIIMRRYEKRSTMMTSNRLIEEWGKLLNDVPYPSE